VNKVVDPTFAFMTVDHDGRNPHGLLESLRHGPAGRAEGPLPRRLRERYRRRPARYRRAFGGTPQSESLSSPWRSAIC
jgi:hypothetical protein